MRVLYMIGNGFDMNIGYPTSFGKILDNYLNESSSSNSDPIIKAFKDAIKKNDRAWSNFELWLGEYTQELLNPEDLLKILSDFTSSFMRYLEKAEKSIDLSTRLLDDKTQAALACDILIPELHIDDNRKNKLNRMINAAYKEFNFATFNYSQSLDKAIDAIKSFEIPVEEWRTEYRYNPIFSNTFKKIKKNKKMIALILIAEFIVIMMLAWVIVSPTSSYDTALSWFIKNIIQSDSFDITRVKYIMYHSNYVLFSAINMFFIIREAIGLVKWIPRSGIKINDAIHLHGKTDRMSIVGVDNIRQVANEKFRKSELSKLALVKFYVNTKRPDSPVKKVKSLIRKSDLIVVHGMSFGETDRQWWREIIRWTNRSFFRKKLAILFNYEPNLDELISANIIYSNEEAIKRFKNSAGKRFVNRRRVQVVSYGEQNKEAIFRSIKCCNDPSYRIDNDIKYAQAYINNGDEYYRRSSYERALDAYEKALKFNDTNPNVHYDIGMIYFYLGRYKQAILKLSEAIAINPLNASFFLARGNASFEVDEYTDAVNDYLSCIRIDPKDAVYYYNIGVAHEKMNNYDIAIDFYGRALCLDEGYIFAYENRGTIYIGKKEFDKAINDFKMALEIDPSCIKDQFFLGVAYNGAKKHEIALRYFNQVLRIDENYDYIYYWIGIALQDMGRHKEAIENFTRSINIKPNHSSAYIFRAISYKNLKKKAEAEADYRKAKEINMATSKDA